MFGRMFWSFWTCYHKNLIFHIFIMFPLFMLKLDFFFSTYGGVMRIASQIFPQKNLINKVLLNSLTVFSKFSYNNFS